MMVMMKWRWHDGEMAVDNNWMIFSDSLTMARANLWAEVVKCVFFNG